VAGPTATQDAVSRWGWLDRDWNTTVKGAGPAIPLWGEGRSAAWNEARDHSGRVAISPNGLAGLPER